MEMSHIRGDKLCVNRWSDVEDLSIIYYKTLQRQSELRALMIFVSSFSHNLFFFYLKFKFVYLSVTVGRCRQIARNYYIHNSFIDFIIYQLVHHHFIYYFNTCVSYQPFECVFFNFRPITTKNNPCPQL